MQPVHWGHKKRIKVLTKILNGLVSSKNQWILYTYLLNLDVDYITWLVYGNVMTVVRFSCLIQNFSCKPEWNHILTHHQWNSFSVYLQFRKQSRLKWSIFIHKRCSFKKKTKQNKVGLIIWSEYMGKIFALYKHAVIIITILLNSSVLCV